MKLLVVEDDRRIARAVKRGLEQLSHVVDVAEDGEQGYDMASSEEYDVVILDVMMPKMDGFAVCVKLREEGVEVPVLMLTAKGEVEDRVEGLRGGADDYLVKPFAFDELVARIEALSRRPRKREAEVLQVEELEMDTGSYSVRRQDKEIELSKKEYALLEYFVRNKGRVVSAEQLTEAVWSFESDVLPNTAQVYVGYLRSKVDKPFDLPPLIETVRGFGYRFGGGDV